MQSKINLGLERISSLSSHFPAFTRPTIHIAGTNGKGSISALLSSLFLATAPPLRLGRFTSPHLISVLDCIILDGQPVSQSLYDSVRKDIFEKEEEHRTGVSNFEILTLTALLIFERVGVDLVICEVGMGGRLDATNVIPDEAVAVSVISSIGLDHQLFLGGTAAEIAREKAGIIRSGKPVVLSPQTFEEVFGVVEKVAEEVGSEVVVAATAVERPWGKILDGSPPPAFSLHPFSPPPPRPVTVNIPHRDAYQVLLSLQGKHQLENLGVALNVLDLIKHHPSIRPELKYRALTLSPSAIYKAIRDTTWPGRISYHLYPPKGTVGDHDQIPVLVDGAHNQASAQAFSAYLKQISRPWESDNEGKPNSEQRLVIAFILALSHSPPKTPRDVLEPLLSVWRPENPGTSIQISAVRFSPPEGMPWVSSVTPSAIIAEAKQLYPGATFQVCDDSNVEPRRELALALDRASSNRALLDTKNHLVVVTGSLYLVSDFYRLLGQI